MAWFDPLNNSGVVAFDFFLLHFFIVIVIINFLIDFGQKMIQFNIQFKTKDIH